MSRASSASSRSEGGSGSAPGSPMSNGAVLSLRDSTELVGSIRARRRVPPLQQQQEQERVQARSTGGADKATTKHSPRTTSGRSTPKVLRIPEGSQIRGRTPTPILSRPGSPTGPANIALGKLSDDEIGHILLFLPVHHITTVCSRVNQRLYSIVHRDPYSSAHLWDFLFHRDTPPALHYLAILLLKHSIVLQTSTCSYVKRSLPNSGDSNEDVMASEWLREKSASQGDFLVGSGARPEATETTSRESAGTAGTVNGLQINILPVPAGTRGSRSPTRDGEDGGEAMGREEGGVDGEGDESLRRSEGRSDSSILLGANESGAAVEVIPSEKQEVVDPAQQDSDRQESVSQEIVNESVAALTAPATKSMDINAFFRALDANISELRTNAKLLCQAPIRTATLTSTEALMLEKTLPEGSFEVFLKYSSWKQLYLKLQQANFLEEVAIEKYLVKLEDLSSFPNCISGYFAPPDLAQKKCWEGMIQFFNTTNSSSLMQVCSHVQDDLKAQYSSAVNAQRAATIAAIQSERNRAIALGKDDPYPEGRLTDEQRQQRVASRDEERTADARSLAENRWNKMRERNRAKRLQERNFLPSYEWRLERYRRIRRKLLAAPLLAETYNSAALGFRIGCAMCGVQVAGMVILIAVRIVVLFLNQLEVSIPGFEDWFDATFSIPSFGVYPIWFQKAVTLISAPISKGSSGIAADGTYLDAAATSNSFAMAGFHTSNAISGEEAITTSSGERVSVFLVAAWFVCLFAIRAVKVLYFYPKVSNEATQVATLSQRALEVFGEISVAYGSLSCICGPVWMLKAFLHPDIAEAPIPWSHIILALVGNVLCYRLFRRRTLSRFSAIVISIPFAFFEIRMLAPNLFFLYSFAFEHCRDWTYWVLNPTELAGLTSAARAWRSWPQNDQTSIMTMYCGVLTVAIVRGIAFRFSFFNRTLNELIPQISDAELGFWQRQQYRIHQTRPYLDVISELVNAKSSDEALAARGNLLKGAILTYIEELLLGGMFIATLVQDSDVVKSITIRVLLGCLLRVGQQILVRNVKEKTPKLL